MAEYSKELIQNTIDVWSPKYGYDISEAEAIEIIRNLTSFFEVLRDMADDKLRKLNSDLINSKDFRRVSEIDSAVPDDHGLYCLRLAIGSHLPDGYQKELEKREARLLYIGKAEGRGLRERMLEEELRGRRHGTFFRSVGTMLGFQPPRGSLKDKTNQNNYRYAKADRAEIIHWMNENLEVSWTLFKGPFIFEKYLIEDHAPLLNIKHNPNPFDMLIRDRDKCRQVAKSSK